MSSKREPLDLADAMAMVEFMKDQKVQSFSLGDLRVTFRDDARPNPLYVDEDEEDEQTSEPPCNLVKDE